MPRSSGPAPAATPGGAEPAHAPIPGSSEPAPTDAKPAPVPRALTRPYWDAAACSELSIPRCGACGAWVSPARPRCTSCGSTNLEWCSPARTGEVVTFTVVHQAAYAAYKSDVPYVVAIVRLDDGPQLMSNLVEVGDLDALAIGQRVEVVFEQRGDGAIPQFRPLR